MDVRARLGELLDRESFVEIDKTAVHDCSHFGTSDRHIEGDGIVTGYGTINGRKVFVYGHDARFLKGSSSRVHGAKICKIVELALKVGAPIVSLNDSAGIRVHEGLDAAVRFADVFHKTVKASGVVPQISLLFGDCAGGAAYTPALTDFLIMPATGSSIFLTGPEVISVATGERVSTEEIGGSQVHGQITGLVHFVEQTESECLALARRLLSFLPQNNCGPAPAISGGDTGLRSTPALASIIPKDPSKSFDMRLVIHEIADDGDFLEVHAGYARNILVGFVRLAGSVVGIVANQPSVLSGCLDIKSSEKAARFVRFCDAFGIPLLGLVDVPGYLPGRDQERNGIINAGAKLLHAYCASTVPKVAVIIRKAIGGAYPTLANFTATDLCFALPDAEIAVMGAGGAVEVIFRKELAAASDPTKRRKELIEDYRAQHGSAASAAARGYIDQLVPPDSLRNAVLSGMELLRTKIPGEPLRKLSTIPL